MGAKRRRQNSDTNPEAQAPAALPNERVPLPTVELPDAAAPAHPSAAMKERLLIDALPPDELVKQAAALRVQLQKEIAEREQAEHALRESDSRFRALVLASSDVVYRMNPNWSEMAHLHGRNFIADADASRTWFEDYIPLADQPGVRAAIDEAIRTKSIFELEHRVRRVDGTVGWTFSRAIPLLDQNGEIFEWFGAASDVSAPREAQEVALFQKSLLEGLSESVVDGILIVSPDGKMLHYNRRFLEIWNFPQAVLDSKSDEDALQWVAGQTADPAAFLAGVAAAYQAPELRLREELLMEDGRVYERCGSPARVGETRFGWVWTFRDVTERRSAVENLRSAKEQAEAASCAKDDFLAALSHELRTPLTPVLMAAASLESDLALPLEVRSQLAMMRRNVELEARLIDDLLDLTRISRGKLQIAPVIADLHQLLEYTAEIVRADGLEKQVRIYFLLEAARLHALVDPTRLQQVFWNLIKNAIKFTSPGGTVNVSTRNDAQGRILVSVEDTGVGIGIDALPHIFNAFEQGAIAGQHRYGGLGLGLAIARAIVEAHCGEIRVESPGVGHGATFTVALATVDAPAVPLRTSVLASGPKCEVRLLVVEDHEATRTVLAQVLTRGGDHVTTATTVADALTAFGAEHFDAVISDIGLPDGSGLDLMRAIQRLRPIPGIALSGYGMEEDVRRSKDAGFSAHLVKPVNLAELRLLIEHFVLPG